jgi:asparagine synthase (glutamine-hydrolysing)
MAHSVEGRFPFLDYRVVEFCNRLPADVKLRGLNEKYLLRRLGQKLLPPEIWKRTKRPYRAPIQRSFLADAPALEYVRDLLSPRAVTASGLFNPFAVEKLLTKAESGVQLSETEEMGLVGILSTQLVDRLFVHGDFSLRNYGPLEPFKLVNRLPA